MVEGEQRRRGAADDARHEAVVKAGYAEGEAEHRHIQLIAVVEATTATTSTPAAATRWCDVRWVGIAGGGTAST
jgi:hypothetical protein